MQDPFFDYVPERIRPKRPWLTNDEIERLMQIHTKHATWNFTRDMFIFCVFTGITAIDLRNLKYSNIQRQEDGSLWVVLNRQKTGTASYIPLLDIPIQILDRYRNSEFAGEDGRVFKLQTHVNINWQLKKLAKVAEINKRLTFHVSRHTFSTTVILAKGVPIESVSKMLGHTNIKTTQIYARITDSKVGHDMAELAEKMNKKKTEEPVKPNTPKNVILETVHPKPSICSQVKGLDLEFENLHLDENLNLLNIEYEMQTLANNADKLEKKVCEVWNKLSDKAKHYFFDKSFEKSKPTLTIYQPVIN